MKSPRGFSARLYTRDFLPLEELLKKGRKGRRFIRILLFVEGVVSLVRGLILERR